VERSRNDLSVPKAARAGWPSDARVFRFADRFLFRLLSRDDDPALLVEFQRPAKTDPGLTLWARSMGGQAAAAALARGAHQDDPRLRGAAHRIASDISMYLRSEVAQKPFKKAQGKTVLDPLTYPTTVFSVEMLAFMPAVQRERAGFLERLAAYFSIPTPRRSFFILAGKKVLKPLLRSSVTRSTLTRRAGSLTCRSPCTGSSCSRGSVSSAKCPAPRRCSRGSIASATIRGSGVPLACA